jgi:hypothetical protein
MKKTASTNKIVALLALIFAAALTSCATLLGETYGNFYYINKSDGTISIIGCKKEEVRNGHLTIPDTINGIPVTDIGTNAFSNLTNLTSVTIPSSVTTIWSLAFFNCKNMISVTISSMAASIKSYAFSNCKSLKTVTLSPDADYDSSAFPLGVEFVYVDSVLPKPQPATATPPKPAASAIQHEDYLFEVFTLPAGYSADWRGMGAFDTTGMDFSADEFKNKEAVANSYYKNGSLKPVAFNAELGKLLFYFFLEFTQVSMNGGYLPPAYEEACRWYVVKNYPLNGRRITLNVYLHYLPALNRAGAPTAIKKWAAFEGKVPETVLKYPLANHQSAVKEKVAAITWEFRKYNEIIPEAEIDSRYKGYTYKRMDIVVTFDGPQNFLDEFNRYRDSDLRNLSKNLLGLSPNSFRISQVYSDERPVEDWGDSFTILNVWLNNKPTILATAEKLAQTMMNRDRSHRYMAEPGFDFDQEKVYFTDTGPYRTDEKGVKYHSFKAAYIIYRY